jgi:hypothetical protein
MFASFRRGRLDGVEVGIRERVTGLEVAGRAQRERGLLEADVAVCRRRIENLHGLSDHLDTDAITRDDG